MAEQWWKAAPVADAQPTGGGQWWKAAPTAKPPGDGSPEKPYDLSGGQSRAKLPKGAYYLDPRGNLRRNENADRGNPIVVPADRRTDRNPYGVDIGASDRQRTGGVRNLIAPETGARRGQRRSGGAEFQGVLNNLYRGTGILDEGQAAFTTLAETLAGRTKPRSVPGDAVINGSSQINVMPSLVAGARGMGDTYRNALAWQRGSEDDFTTRRPLAAGTARGVGTTATLFVPGGAPAQMAAAPSRAVGALRGATVAAAQGYGYGLADRGTLDERVQSANTSAAVSGVLGGVLGGALGGPSKAPRPADRPELNALQERAKVDVPAARSAAQEYRGVGIAPTLADVTDDSARGVIRATGSRMTPARQAVTDFRDARALDLPDRIGGQARRVISGDSRTPDQIRAALTAERKTAADASFGALRNEPVVMDADTVMALRSPDGRAAIRAAASDAQNSLDPADRAIAAELNRLADAAVDDPSTQITVGMAQSISASLLDAAEVSQRGGRNNSARILGSLGRAIRENARTAVPQYDEALQGYAASSRLIDAADVGEGFMARNTDEFVDAVGRMGPEELEVARAAARRGVERSAGESPGAAPGVARRLATAPEQQQRNAALLGPEGATQFQNALSLEERAVRNANDIAPRTGSQTQLRSQDAERAAGAIDTGLRVLRQDWAGLAVDWLKSRGIKDPVAQRLTEAAIDPAGLDDALTYLEQRYGKRAAQDFVDWRQASAIDAARVGRIGGAAVANTNSQRPNALATSPQ